MSYQITVWRKKGGHYFTTGEQSVAYEDDALELAADFRKRFPESEGFGVVLSKSTTVTRAYENSALDKFIKRIKP